MLALRVVQAAFGDCMFVRYGPADASKYLLVDGGPPGVFDAHLLPELVRLSRAGARLDRVILSHVDNDHVIGLLDFFAEQSRRRVNAERDLIRIGGIWHNSFEDTVDPARTIEKRLARVVASAGRKMALSGIAVRGIGEGRRLTSRARELGLAINKETKGAPITIASLPKSVRMGALRVRVLGPSEKILAELREEWAAWLASQEALIARGRKVAANADQSVPNLSSLVLLFSASGATLLMTGDARGDHVLAGLKSARLLGASERFHVNLLKVQHHASDRNATASFFEKVTADKYVISADGRYGNPDVAVLEWIVDAARAAKRRIEIFVTNETAAVKKLVSSRVPKKYGYRLRVLKPGAHAIEVPIAP